MFKNKKGFSLVELIVVIAILVVFAAVLIPSLLQYTENSRAQKDVSAMDEVVNAVQLAMADEDCFDEMLQYSCNNNFMTYTDSSGNYGQQIIDGEFWAPDGSGKATTITFNPVMNDNGAIYYELAKAYVNDMTMDNGSTTQERIMEGQIIDENQCYLKDASIDGQGMSKLYAYLKSTIGETFANTSQTYKNSSFTVFIRFTQKDGVTVADVYGQFNGTNLHDGAAASMGSGTTEYNVNTGDAITSISGGTMQAQFGTSDLIGTGTFCPSMTEERIEHNDTVVDGGSYEHRGYYDYSAGYKDWDGDGDKEYKYVEGEKFEAGDEMPEPKVGDIYIYGDYEYHYNEWINVWDESYWDYEYDEDGNVVCDEYGNPVEKYYEEWYEEWQDKYYYYEEWEDEHGNVHVYEEGEPYEDGWTVVVRDTSKSTYGQILTEINGYPVNGMTYTYANCNNITDISFVKVPETTENMSYLFFQCNSIKEIPNSFKIPRYVNNVSGLFYGCDNITTIPKTFTFPTTIEDCSYTFAGCGMTEIPTTLRLHDGIKNLEHMFASSQLEYVPDTFILPASARNISYMFYECKKLKTIDENFIIPSSVDNMNYMFYDTGITSLPNNFQLPTTASYTCIFAYCSKLEKLPDDFQLVVNEKMASFSSFFSGCKSLKELPQNFTIPNGTTNIASMFSACESLEQLPENFTVPDGVTNTNNMFAYSGIKQLPTNFTLPDSVTNTSFMFLRCANLQRLSPSFNIPANTTTVYGMFWDCAELVELPEGFTLNDAVIDAGTMFDRCYKLKALPNSFRLGKNTNDIGEMFYYCTSLEYIPDGFNFGNSTIDVDGAFRECHNLKSVPSSLIISDNTTMQRQLFQNNYQLTGTIYVGITSTSYASSMFKGTQKPIVLMPISPESLDVCNTIASYYSNVTVGQLQTVSITIDNQCADLVDIDVPDELYGGYTNVPLIVKEEEMFVESFKMNGETIVGDGFVVPRNGGHVIISDVKLTNSLTVESAHYGYPNSHDKIYFEQTFSGAKSITITLDIQTESTSCDWVHIYGKNNTQIKDPSDNDYKFGGTSRKTQTITVPGNYVKLMFRTDGSVNNYYGFKATITPNYNSSAPILTGTQVFESKHNTYPNSVNYETYGEGMFKDAKSITIVLDIQTESTTYDWVEIYDADDNKIKDPSDNDYKFGGTTRKTQTITVPGNYFKIVFRTDGSVNTYYGFKATVTPNY